MILSLIVLNSCKYRGSKSFCLFILGSSNCYVLVAHYAGSCTNITHNKLVDIYYIPQAIGILLFKWRKLWRQIKLIHVIIHTFRSFWLACILRKFQSIPMETDTEFTCLYPSHKMFRTVASTPSELFQHHLAAGGLLALACDGASPFLLPKVCTGLFRY